MDNKEEDLCLYRYQTAVETLETAKLCMENRHYKDAISKKLRWHSIMRKNGKSGGE